MVVAPFGNKPVGRTLYDVWSVISVKELYYQHMEAIGTPGAFFVFKYFCKCGNVNLLTSKIFPTFANNP